MGKLFSGYGLATLPLDGSEQVSILQGGINKKTLIGNLSADGLIQIYDPLGEFFTSLATATAYTRTFYPVGSLTDESFNDKVYSFTVPAGSNFSSANFFLADGINYVQRTANIIDTFGLIGAFGGSAFLSSSSNNTLGNCTFGDSAFVNSPGNNILGNCTFGDYAFVSSTGSNTLGDCTFGISAFSNSSSNNTLGNCTFGISAFVNSLGINTLGSCTFGDYAFSNSFGINTLSNCTFGDNAFSNSSSNNTLGNCTFGDYAFYYTSGHNRLRNCTFGDNAFIESFGSNTLGDCTFGISAFSDSSSNNILGDCIFGDSSFNGSSGSNTLGNCTFGNSAFLYATGVYTIKNILLTNLIHSFAEFSTGRFYLNGTIGTTTAAQYANFFLTSTAEIRARRASYTNNAGGIEGDLVTAKANGANLFFGGIDKEDVSNKVTTLAGANNTTYPTTLTVSNAITAGVTGVELLVHKGVANGYASLDGNGLVPSSQLPTYIDDVVEGTWINSTTFNDLSSNPYIPAIGLIYIDTTTNLTYRWSGSIYVKLTDGGVNSFNSRTGAVLPISGDYNTSIIADTTNKRYQTDNQQAFNDATSSIQTQLNTKENAITATTSADFWSGAKTFINFATTVRSTILTGLSNATNQAIVATDTVILALGYLQGQINANISSIALKSNIANPTFTGIVTTPALNAGGQIKLYLTSGAANTESPRVSFYHATTVQTSYISDTIINNTSQLNFNVSNYNFSGYKQIITLRGDDNNTLSDYCQINSSKLKVISKSYFGPSAGTIDATAKVHIEAGTATAGTAPLKLSAGVLLTSAEAGVVENDATNLFYTPHTTVSRRLIPLQLYASLGAVAPGSLSFLTNTTVNVTPNATGTFTTTVPVASTEVCLIIVTSGTTPYTLTFGSGFLTTGTLDTGAVTSKTFVIKFISNGTTLIEISRTIAM